MNFIKLPDVYPYHLSRLRADYPDTSFPQPYELADLTDFGVYPVKPTAKPAYDPITQGLDASASLVAGEWVQVWTIRAATAAEARQAEDESSKTFAKADATIRYLVTHTPAEIEAKVATDGATLAGLRSVVAKLGVAVGALARKELRDN